MHSWTFDEGSYHWSSRGDTASKLRSVGSLDAAGRSSREAVVGRVVEYSWTIVAES